MVELMGLSETQSEAAKSEIRNLIWGRGFLSYGIYLTADEISEIHQKQLEVK